MKSAGLEQKPLPRINKNAGRMLDFNMPEVCTEAHIKKTIIEWIDLVKMGWVDRTTALHWFAVGLMLGPKKPTQRRINWDCLREIFNDMGEEGKRYLRDVGQLYQKER